MNRHPSFLPIFIKAARTPSPTHAVEPVAKLWAEKEREEKQHLARGLGGGGGYSKMGGVSIHHCIGRLIAAGLQIQTSGSQGHPRSTTTNEVVQGVLWGLSDLSAEACRHSKNGS